MSVYDQLAFYLAVRKFYSELTDRLISYMPLHSKLLHGLRFADPSYLLSPDFNFDKTVLRVAKAMTTVVPADRLDDLRLETTKLRTSCPDELSADMQPETFWSKLPVSTYPHLAHLGRAACCIPHGNADSERVIKWIGANLTKQRNKLGDVTLESLLAIKVWMKSSSCNASSLSVGPALLAAGFDAKAKADDRARRKQNEKTIAKLQQGFDALRRADAEKEKAAELQRQKQQEQNHEQKLIDETRKKARELLAQAEKAEEKLRKRQSEPAAAGVLPKKKK